LTSAASAGTVTIGFQEAGVNGGAITSAGSGTGSDIFSGSYGTFTINQVSGAIVPAPGVLNSASLNVSGTTAGTLNVFITASDLTSPLGSVNWITTLTSNTLSGGVTSVFEQAFGNANNAVLPASGFLLGSANFTAIGTVVAPTVTWPTGAGPYSVTEEYTITATGVGTANDTIDLSGTASGVPGPILGAGLPFLAIGYGAMWLVRRNRRKTA